MRERLARWYWCGVLGELYGGATESRLARDLPELLAWMDGGPEPSTVTEAIFTYVAIGENRRPRALPPGP